MLNICIIYMTDKNELVNNVKNWISIDNDIKELQKVIKKNARKRKFTPRN